MYNIRMKAVAITHTVNFRDKNIVDIKLCYISRHPDKKTLKWFTHKVSYILKSSIFLSDLMDFYSVYYKVPILENIKKDDLVSDHQIKKLVSMGIIPELKN